MAAELQAGDHAPNFDLTSTEGVVLMLRDEVPRTAVVLYFFADPGDERARADLLALARARAGLAQLPAAILAVSPAKLDALRDVQRELKLPFPLLVDDRDFSARAYGVAAAIEGEPAPPALVAVDRREQIVWIANPVDSVEAAMPQVEAALKRLPSPVDNLPRRVTNRLIDRWVNKMPGLRRRRA